MRVLAALWCVAVFAITTLEDGSGEPCSENSVESKAESEPFAGSPRGYGIAFPQLIKTYVTGAVRKEYDGYIDIANEQYQNGRSVFIPLDHVAVKIVKMKDFDVQVTNDYYYNPNRFGPPGSIVERHPDKLWLQSTPPRDYL